MLPGWPAGWLAGCLAGWLSNGWQAGRLSEGWQAVEWLAAGLLTMMWVMPPWSAGTHSSSSTLQVRLQGGDRGRMGQGQRQEQGRMHISEGC